MGELKFDEYARLVMAGEMSQQAAADALHMKRSTFAYHLYRKYPERQKGVQVRKENRKPVVIPKRVKTYLERTYTDQSLCNDLKCTHCPMKDKNGKCTGPEGLIEALLKRGRA